MELIIKNNKFRITYFNVTELSIGGFENKELLLYHQIEGKRSTFTLDLKETKQLIEFLQKQSEVMKL